MGGPDEFGAGKAVGEVLEHPGMRVDADELHTGTGHRDRQATGADPEIEHRRKGCAGKVQPRPEVGRVRQLLVELGEVGVGLERVVRG